MTTKQKIRIGIVVAFIAGGAVGTFIGGRFGFQVGLNMVLNQALQGNARDITSRVASLRELRAGQRDKAIASIETGMDDALILFDPQTPYSDLKPRTVSEIKKAIDQAKMYRSKYPHANKDNIRAKMVNSLFERDLYK